jgi:hypothetical protein
MTAMGAVRLAYFSLHIHLLLSQATLGEINQGVAALLIHVAFHSAVL